ncbi:MAG: MoxR family ATPase [Candidatus Pacearchaeota archaeon]
MLKKISHSKGEEYIKRGVVEEISYYIKSMKNEISKIFLGQEEVVNLLINALICNGHVLVEGVPGIAKTLAVLSLARVSGCSSKRIQFTVDLLPADIIGITVYNVGKGYEVIKGPIFTNFLVADEINRASPKTQSALIEAMQERQVTIGNETHILPKPFFVMATQNPIETEGVYPLPEAQLDRFLFKIIFTYPRREIEKMVMEQNITFKHFSEYNLKPIVSPKQILDIQKEVHKIYCDDKIKDYILDIVEKTRSKNSKYSEYIEMGVSPRASIALYLSSKAEALMNGRVFVIPADVKKIALECLRHRLILNYKAYSNKLSADDIIKSIIDETKTP